MRWRQVFVNYFIAFWNTFMSQTMTESFRLVQQFGAFFVAILVSFGYLEHKNFLWEMESERVRGWDNGERSGEGGEHERQILLMN